MMRGEKNVALGAVTAALVPLVFLPLAFVFAMAFVPGSGSKGLSPMAFIAEHAPIVLNSLRLGFWVVVLASLISFPLAFLLTRTEFVRRSWLDILLLVPFMTPPYISSMGWILFMQPRGLLNQLAPFTKGWDAAFFGFPGLALVMTLNVFPFMVKILANALSNIGRNLEEAAAVFGAGPFTRLTRVTLPLLVGNYAIGALMVFVKTLSEYGTPATLGKRIGYEVFTSRIHFNATMAPIDFGQAALLSSILTGICLSLWLIQSVVTKRASYALIGGKGAGGAVRPLSRPVAALAWAYVGLILLVSIGVPYFSVIVTSLIKIRGFGLRPGNFSLVNYVALFTQNPKGRDALATSFGLGLVAASIAAFLGTVAAFAAHKARVRLKAVVDFLGVLPEMVPNIVMVIGLSLFWNMLAGVIPVYNSTAMLIVAYVAMFLPFTVQYVKSALTQVNDGLIQAGRVFGGTPAYVIRRILLPLTLNGIIAGWTMTFIISFRELVASSIVSPPGVITVSTFIMREFEQGSVPVGMCMAVICVLFTTGVLLAVDGIKKNSK